MSEPAAKKSEPLWARAARALEARSAPMPLADFWTEVANLGWGTRFRDAANAGQELCRMHSPQRLTEMRLRFRQLEAQLARAIELWSMQNEEHVGLPKELQVELREHVIGLGELAYGAALQGPWRVKHRGDRDDFLEGFGRAFDEALRRYPAELLESVLERG